MLERWESSLNTGALLDVGHEMTHATLQVVTDTLFGIDVPEAVEVVERTLPSLFHFGLERVVAPIALPLWLPFPKHKAVRELKRELDAFIYGLIARKRAQNDESAEDLLTTLIYARDVDTGEAMSDRELRDEIMTFFLAGHETSAIALTWALYLISAHRDVEESLRSELQSVLSGRVPTFEDLPKLTYLRAVIQESMRLFPPVWSIGRQALNDDVIGGYPISRGTNVITTPFLVHRNPQYWTSPDEFQPERFLEPRAAEIPKFAYFPFGAGPRTCIGNNFAMMEMQILLAMMLQKFRIITDAEHPGFQFSLTLRPKRPILARLEKLDRKS